MSADMDFLSRGPCRSRPAIPAPPGVFRILCRAAVLKELSIQESRNLGWAPMFDLAATTANPVSKDQLKPLRHVGHAKSRSREVSARDEVAGLKSARSSRRQSVQARRLRP